MVLRTVNTVLRSIRRGKGRGSLVDVAGTAAISKGNAGAGYARGTIPQTKMSAKDLAISFTEKCPPARSDKYV